MADTPETEMVKVLKSAIETGEVLDVPIEAARIGALYEVDPAGVARDLTESGLLVGVNMAMGAPEPPVTKKPVTKKKGLAA